MSQPYGGCPGSAMRNFAAEGAAETQVESGRQTPELKQWPIQLHLIGPQAPYFRKADLLVTADCVPFAYPNYHSDFLKGRSVVIACPKLDDTNGYAEKLAELIKTNDLKSITVAIMEVPCCYGLYAIVEEALRNSGKQVPLHQQVVSVRGGKL